VVLPLVVALVEKMVSAVECTPLALLYLLLLLLHLFPLYLICLGAPLGPSLEEPRLSSGIVQAGPA